MNLIDQIHEYGAAWPIAASGLASPALNVSQVPVKYILDEEVTKICERLVSEHFDMLADMVGFARMPSEFFWVERRSATQAKGDRTLKLGSLVISDEGGRSGDVLLVVEADGAKPILLPQKIIFDFDHPLTDDLRAGIMTVPLAPRADEKQRIISRHFAVKIQDNWSAYYDVMRKTGAQLADIRAQMCQSLWDGLFLMAFTLLLSSRKNFREVPVTLSRLNRKRTRVGKKPLLDYVEVKQKIVQPELIGHHRSAAVASGRREPRMHIVRGHFVRKGPDIFWRRSHLRGTSHQAILSKTVRLSV